MEDTVSQIESLYNQLHHFSESKQQEEALKASSEILHLIGTLPALEHLPKQHRAKILLFKGRALCVEGKYDKQAEDALSRSVKLDPTSGETWIWLGEIFYLKKDYLQSKRCFEGALENSGENKVALRKLSMISRFLADDIDRARVIQESVGMAKRAVGIDLKDGYSWYVLGNAHLTNFFVNNPSSEELNKALESYGQAERLLVTPEADLHYNRAEIYRYLERYQEAMTDYLRAHELDPELESDKVVEQLIGKLRDISVQINNKNGIKKKPLKKLVKNLASAETRSFGASFEPSVIREMVLGINGKKTIATKILGVFNEDPTEVPFILLVADSEGSFFTVSLYNINESVHSLLELSATLVIRDPNVVPIRLETPSVSFEYLTVKVVDPNSVLINNRRINESFTPSAIVNQAIK